MKLRIVLRDRWILYAVCTERGDCSLMDFLDGLSGPAARDGRRILRVLKEAAEGGPSRDASSHQITREIWQFSAGAVRVLWFYGSPRSLMLSHGFLKKTRKTPEREKARAERELARYRLAQAGGGFVITEDSW